MIALLDRVDQTDASFWWHATRGEALLLLGSDPRAALQCYLKATRDPECRPRDRHSMRRQLEWLRPHLEDPSRAALSDAALDDLFQK